MTKELDKLLDYSNEMLAHAKTLSGKLGAVELHMFCFVHGQFQEVIKTMKSDNKPEVTKLDNIIQLNFKEKKVNDEVK